MSHFTQAIRKYSSLLGIVTEAGEMWNQIEIKDPWDYCNKRSGSMQYLLEHREREYRINAHLLELAACMRDNPELQDFDIQIGLDHFRKPHIPLVDEYRRKHEPNPRNLPYEFPNRWRGLIDHLSTI